MVIVAHCLFAFTFPAWEWNHFACNKLEISVKFVDITSQLGYTLATPEETRQTSCWLINAVTYGKLRTSHSWAQKFDHLICLSANSQCSCLAWEPDIMSNEIFCWQYAAGNKEIIIEACSTMATRLQPSNFMIYKWLLDTQFQSVFQVLDDFECFGK